MILRQAGGLLNVSVIAKDADIDLHMAELLLQMAPLIRFVAS
jgi:hypothetical protein